MEHYRKEKTSRKCLGPSKVKISIYRLIGIEQIYCHIKKISDTMRKRLPILYVFLESLFIKGVLWHPKESLSQTKNKLKKVLSDWYGLTPVRTQFKQKFIQRLSSRAH